MEVHAGICVGTERASLRIVGEKEKICLLKLWWLATPCSAFELSVPCLWAPGLIYSVLNAFEEKGGCRLRDESVPIVPTGAPDS